MDWIAFDLTLCLIILKCPPVAPSPCLFERLKTHHYKWASCRSDIKLKFSLILFILNVNFKEGLKIVAFWNGHVDWLVERMLYITPRAILKSTIAEPVCKGNCWNLLPSIHGKNRFGHWWHLHALGGVSRASGLWIDWLLFPGPRC